MSDSELFSWFKDLTLAERRAVCAIVDDAVFVNFFLGLITANTDVVGACDFFSREYLLKNFEVARNDVRTLARWRHKFSSNKGDNICLQENILCSVEETVSSQGDDYVDPFSSVSSLVNVYVDRTSDDRASEFARGESFCRCFMASYVTGGNSIDALYVSDDFLRDPIRFYDTLRTLSRGGALSHSPPPISDCRPMVAGKSLPEIEWLFSQFSNGTSYLVPAYAVLAARIEISMWIAYISTRSSAVVGIQRNSTQRVTEVRVECVCIIFYALETIHGSN
jgi:hypothetical protein